MNPLSGESKSLLTVQFLYYCTVYTCINVLYLILNAVFFMLRLLNFSMSNDYESLGIGLPGRKSEMVSEYYNT